VFFFWDVCSSPLSSFHVAASQMTQQEAKNAVEMVSKSITDKFFSLPRLVLNTIKTNKGTYLKNMHTKCT
jgi:uncharacterized protein YajQ (UPF0234 family)